MDGRGHSSPGCCYVSREVYETQLALSNSWENFRRLVRDHYTLPFGVMIDDIKQAARLLKLVGGTDD